MRMNTKKLILASLLLSAALLAAGSAYAATIYFPHVDTSLPWQTEIAIVNTSDQTVTGTLRGLSDAGQLVETKPVTLSGHGRRQIVVANEFTNHIDIGYIVFDASSDTVQGYTKFYQAGIYRAAIPAVKEVNTTDIFISHIDSSADWWTGISLVNTTSSAKVLTITFNDGQSRQITINANAHMPLTIESLFNNQPQPDIKSAVITNANGIIGLELFGNVGGSNHLDGLLLSDNTTSTIYYPHVASDNVWWTGIVAYNPSELAGSITITPYSAQGTLLSSSTLPLPGKGKYIGAVAQLGLPDQTAWFKIDSTSPITGFELFGTLDGNLLAAYAEGGGTGAKTGIFAKIEKDGWTGIAFVNTEATAASVTLTAYDDNGTVVATQVLPVGGHAKVVNLAEAIFSQNIGNAAYITYASDRNVVGFQLNGSSDGTMLDGLPALAGAAPTSGVNGTITGTAMKGPVNGATVTAFAINGGVMGAQIGTGTTDAQGNFTMAIGAYSGPVMLRMSGGTYTDEATGASMTMQSGDIMTSMMPQVIAGAVMSGVQITPLTSMAQMRAQSMSGGMTPGNITAANTAMGNYFLVGDILYTRPMNPLTTGSGTGATQDMRNYGMVIAAMSQYAQTIGMPISSGMVTVMMNDASDGIMNGMMGNTQIMMGGMGGMMGNNPMSTSAGTSGLASAMTTFMGSAMNRSGLTVADMQALMNQMSTSNGQIQ